MHTVPRPAQRRPVAGRAGRGRRAGRRPRPSTGTPDDRPGGASTAHARPPWRPTRRTARAAAAAGQAAVLVDVGEPARRWQLLRTDTAGAAMRRPGPAGRGLAVAGRGRNRRSRRLGSAPSRTARTAAAPDRPFDPPAQRRRWSSPDLHRWQAGRCVALGDDAAVDRCGAPWTPGPRSTREHRAAVHADLALTLHGRAPRSPRNTPAPPRRSPRASVRSASPPACALGSRGDRPRCTRTASHGRPRPRTRWSPTSQRVTAAARSTGDPSGQLVGRAYGSSLPGEPPARPARAARPGRADVADPGPHPLQRRSPRSPPRRGPAGGARARRVVDPRAVARRARPPARRRPRRAPPRCARPAGAGPRPPSASGMPSSPARATASAAGRARSGRRRRGRPCSPRRRRPTSRMPALAACTPSPMPGREQHHGGVGQRHDLDLGLADPDGLDQHDVAARPRRAPAAPAAWPRRARRGGRGWPSSG